MEEIIFLYHTDCVLFASN